MPRNAKHIMVTYRDLLEAYIDAKRAVIVGEEFV